MRFALFLIFLVACAMGAGYGLFGNTAVASVLCAIWLLMAVVALVGRGVIDALRVRDGSSEPRGEPGDRGGAVMPSWLK
ncbi:hypothetical protein [Roseateles sp. P5_E7]